ncbi:hypothetical protein N7456_001735 [Penicillium angulare]|uniref:NB-ARC domain-containing protein n=1 Tax=Penicillium angulare TaxID=116970 RepID=A0A9W9G6S7_9EURO|nr:hypothetical protein N7456_001735 [Penicillium angulare]
MPTSLGLHVLYAPAGNPSGIYEYTEDDIVDIVAVHGLGESSSEAWTHDASGTLWLRDLLPKNIPQARVLLYGYDANPLLFTGSNFLDLVQSHATTLIADLEGERNLSNASKRPLVFICHGLGGIIVKNALIHSATRMSRFTSHLNAIYVSTFAILFFGTPHDHIDVGKWVSTSDSICYFKDGPSSLLGRHALDVISNQFAPLMRKIHIYLFWEGLKTKLVSGSDFLVGSTSAAPLGYDTERCGIPDSNHTGMIKFHTAHPTYRTVIAALMKYCRAAPDTITYRWKEASAIHRRMRESEAAELTGLLLEIPDKGPLSINSRRMSNEFVSMNEHFKPPRPVSIDFVGRDDIISLIQNAFRPEQAEAFPRRQKRFVIHGIGGAGKTQIAAKYAQDNRDCYWAILTIDASSLDTAKKSFSTIGRIGGLEATEDSGKHFLSQSKSPWLLIVDNADNPELDFENLVPPGGGGHILVTTRNPLLRRKENVGSVQLDGMESSDALNLLLKVAGLHQPWDLPTQKMGHEITKALGYLALAVFQAGNHVFNKICSLKDYLRVWQHYRERRRKRGESIDKADNSHDLYSVFDISFPMIVSKNTLTSQDAVEMLNVISFYHFDYIRVDTFIEGIRLQRRNSAIAPPLSFRARLVNMLLARLKPPLAVPRLLKEGDDEDNAICLREALCELYTSSLITYSDDGMSFSLHPLIHAWARDRIPPRERTLWATIAFNTIMASIPLPSDKVDQDPEFRRSLVPHLNTCIDACPRVFKDLDDLKSGILYKLKFLYQPTLLSHFRDLIQKSVKCGILFFETGEFVKSVPYLTLAKDSLVHLVGPRDETAMKVMLGLANIYWGLGNLEEAKALQIDVIDSKKQILGPNARETLQAMNELGRSFWQNGEYIEALELQEHTAMTFQAEFGDDDVDTLSALDNLGVTLGSWHRYTESRDIHEKVLSIRRQNGLKEDGSAIIESKKNLAMALLDLGHLKEARCLIEEVYESHKVEMGKEHPWTLWALCYLAKINIEEGNLKTAEEILIEGIAAGKRSLGENHIGILMGTGELARAYARQGYLDKALELCIDTVSRIKLHRGEEHPDFAHGMLKTGQLWELSQNWTKAIESYQVALGTIEKRLTRKHPLFRTLSERVAYLQSLES